MRPSDPIILNQRLRGSAGFTLVELMITTGLLGIVILAVAQLSVTTTRKSQVNKQDTDLSDQIQEFSYAVTTYLSNATQVIACGCGRQCLFDETASPNCALEGTDCKTQPDPILRFETENSADPSQSPSGNCLFAGLNPQDVMLKGCKRRMRLVYTPPVKLPRSNSDRPGAPGVLQLLFENSMGSATHEVVSQLSGVGRLRCGQVDIGTGKPSPDEFHMEIEAKALGTINTGSTQDEGWHPEDANFSYGTHRTVTFNVAMRNFGVPGVQFGKTTSLKNCTPNGAIASSGGSCCSGYERSDHTCIAMDQCKLRGESTQSDLECCSHLSEVNQCL